eukprot:2204709-Pyramimonas_sp.AAC.1
MEAETAPEGSWAEGTWAEGSWAEGPWAEGSWAEGGTQFDSQPPFGQSQWESWDAEKYYERLEAGEE